MQAAVEPCVLGPCRRAVREWADHEQAGSNFGEPLAGTCDPCKEGRALPVARCALKGGFQSGRSAR